MAKLIRFYKRYKDLTKSFVVLGLTFLVLVTSIFTYGWFSENRTVKATGMSVTVQAPDIVDATITAWPVSEIDEDNHIYTFVEDTDFDGALPPFDSPRILSSIYKKAIVLDLCIETAKVNSVVDISIESIKPWIYTEAGMKDDLTSAYYNGISNVTQFRYFTSVNDHDVTFGSTTYSFINNFDKRSASTATKADLSFTSITLPLEGENHVYFVIEYYEDLVDYFCSLSVNVSYSNDIHFRISGGSAA